MTYCISIWQWVLYKEVREKGRKKGKKEKKRIKEITSPGSSINPADEEFRVLGVCM